MTLRGLLETVLLEPLRRIDREQRDYLATDQSRRGDSKVIAVMITAAIVLTVQHYWGNSGTLLTLSDWLDPPPAGRPFLQNAPTEKPDNLGGRLREWTISPDTREIAGNLYWALFSFATYFFLPWFVIVVLFRQRLAEYGLKLKGAFTDWWIYLVFLGVMLPLLFWVSTHDHFQQTFPFYKLRKDEPLWPYFWVWEAAYFLQFVGLEFFFRGFMVHGTKHRFGVYAIFVMAVPYCMIHYGKPMLESFGAIVAGVVLGFMSLKNRSIWMGGAIHMSVALSMDFLSLWRQGRFG